MTHLLRPLAAVALAAVSLLTPDARAQGASFQGLGNLPDGDLSDAWAVSAGGSVVVGQGTNPQGQTEAWRAVLGAPVAGEGGRVSPPPRFTRPLRTHRRAASRSRLTSPRRGACG